MKAMKISFSTSETFLNFFFFYIARHFRIRIINLQTSINNKMKNYIIKIFSMYSLYYKNIKMITIKKYNGIIILF